MQKSSVSLIFKLLVSFLLGVAMLISPHITRAQAANTQFEVKDLAGTKHKLADYKGKWVLVNYWATWCPTCLEEMPDLVNLYDQHKTKNLMVIGIVFDYETTKEVTEYIDNMLISFPVVLGNNAVSAQIGEASVLPTTYIYNPKGELVAIKHGLITKQFIEKLISSK